tara:strand:+ start:1046 stop:1228 length:183 start_codon:yes stop_codon:yes gene_type:complete
LGREAVCNKASIHDLPAIILHQLGFDHERFTHRFNDLDIKLTGVKDTSVIKEIIAWMSAA